MMYTVISIDDILEGIEDEPAITAELVVDGITMTVEPLGAFQARVVRLFSTDPRDYLTPQYQPGSIIRWDIV